MSYKTNTWFWQRVLDGCIKMEDTWHLFLQRENDDIVMDNFAACAHITVFELLCANEARLWLQVICISDLADISGSRIPWDRLNGEWRADPCPDIT